MSEHGVFVPTAAPPDLYQPYVALVQQQCDLFVVLNRAPPMFCTFAPPAGEKNNFLLLRREFVVLRLRKRALLLVPPGVYRPAVPASSALGFTQVFLEAKLTVKYQFLPERVGWDSSESSLVWLILAAVTV